ncbi:glycosyltransferase family 4 protein [Flavobacterium aurantiibacter]|uniref:Glycoside hydrolase n=1 Tax=Flavobacterium aurantiibacter TaxID=2023067 RepID=A0A255ZS79_9FLAO|nr:glycosyltransferase family 4 protein [Flavobacterium aurantiibacter]OYQ44249.1 hypothetical protein CHX27_08050 [Flavobacterium aurantiibacter]
MHIVYLTSHYPLPNAKSVGGIGTSVRNLAVALAQKHAVTVVVYGQECDAVIKDEGVEVRFLSVKCIAGFTWLLTRLRIRKLLKSLPKIDIIEAPDWDGITAFVPLPAPVVVKIHGSDTYFCHLEGRKVKKWNFIREKLALKSAAGIVSVSTFAGRTTAELFGLKKPVTTIFNGVDYAVFSESSKEIVDNSILYVGGLIRKKGLVELASIFNLVVENQPNAKLTLIGKDMADSETGNPSTLGIFFDRLSELARKNVIYLGVVPHQQIKSHFEKSAVCVFPSFAEALPVSWLEALAVGKALVTSNIGWSNEIIDDGVDGFSVDPKDHQLFAERICTLLNDKILRLKFERQGQQKAQKLFAVTEIATRTEAYYQTISRN